MVIKQANRKPQAGPQTGSEVGSGTGSEPGSPRTGWGRDSGGQFRSFCPTDAWTPAINIYRLRRRVEVCIDLAGADPRQVQATVRRGTLVIRGQRPAPEPRCETDRKDAARDDVLRIETMEIDSGRFCREVRLPDAAEPGRVEMHYERGLLWVRVTLE